MDIAIIPARGGSKRIHRKNIKLFHGLPMISYSIKAALESKVFDAVFVSTDDQEIADIAKFYGAEIPWLRPTNLANDYATTVSVIQDAVKKLQPNLHQLDNVCCIYPAVPLIKPKFLDQGLKVFKSGNWDYLFSAMKVNSPHKYFSLGNSSKVEMLFPEFEHGRTQDLPLTYCDAGQFYWGKKDAWELGKPIFSSRSTVLEIPHGSVVDIDTADDWKKAELIFQAQKTKYVKS